MSQQPVVIPKHPVLKTAGDYYALRREGIGFIEQMASRHWTDYNLHDPGITLLEALCYTLTDLGYRLGWDIRDLLAPADPATDTRQPFFTARNILTVNPWTPDDFRRLLIDLDGVRNAWVHCKDCACDLHYLAWCYENTLELGYVIPPDKVAMGYALAPKKQVQLPVAMFPKGLPGRNSGSSKTVKKVSPRGLYEVLLELEADAESGDLNDRKVENTFYVSLNGEFYPLTLELRFPDPTALDEDDYRAFLNSNDTLAGVAATKFVRVKTASASIDDLDLRRNWRGVFYTTLEVTVNPGARKIVFENIALRIFGTDTAKNGTTVNDLLTQIADGTSAGFSWKYRAKCRKTLQAVEEAKTVLHAHRNLDEDFCTVQRVRVEDVAVCCDVEVAPDADIERVQARIWFEIEQYFNPPIRFYSLQELLEEGMPVEDIFQGPGLNNGFIKSAELEAAGLKTELRVSDILNRLMDIEGVVTVNNLLLTKYDGEGQPVAGAADLRAPSPNPKQISARWTLAVTPLHQPRLYYHLSRFLFFKNGLPFLPRPDEARDTLNQLRGEAERPKLKNAGNDLPVPAGQYRDPEDYFPVQYSLPLTYGIGPDGLPSHVPAERRARAKQLKAYLMPFEQILVNALAQVNHTADLFSLDPAVDRSYFVRLIDEALIRDADRIFDGLTAPQLYGLVESEQRFLERRNRFLDHLLARFGEQFREYALLLTNLEGQKKALQDLIADKIAFLKDYPALSHDRAKALNYRADPFDPANVSGLRPRLSKLLGIDAGSPGERFIIVEHLLLRPKFPGDALWPACSDGDCNTCGSEDPYSFRVTFVMPGWSAPYNTNLEMRRFAERTIRQETPSHLLPKICWVGNRGFKPDDCDPILRDITAILEEEPKFTADAQCTCARDIFQRFYLKFRPYFELNKTRHLSEMAWSSLLEKAFSGVSLTGLICLPAGLDPAISDAVRAKMHAYFTEVAVYGYQFARFETAWLQWLAANQPFDWTEEHLHERVEAILATNVKPDVQQPKASDLCQCASDILNRYGQQFYDWMKEKIAAGKSWTDIKAAPAPSPGTLAPCLDGRFTARAETLIRALLQQRYDRYREVSYRLWVLLDLLGKTENTYPVATLHDCDDGSDANPVRLNQTGLGSLRMQEDEAPPPPKKPSLPVLTPPKLQATSKPETLQGKKPKPDAGARAPKKPKKGD